MTEDDKRVDQQNEGHTTGDAHVGVSSPASKSEPIVLDERPDYYVRRSKTRFWFRRVVFPLICIFAVLGAYYAFDYLSKRQSPANEEDDSLWSLSHFTGKVADGKEGEVAERVMKIYSDMLGTPRPQTTTYLSADFRNVLMEVERAEKEGGCTILDHDLWTRADGTDYTMSLKSVTVASAERARAEVVVEGKMSHYFNQEAVVLMLVFSHGQWYVDDIVTAQGSEKLALKNMAEEVLASLSEQQERIDEEQNEPPVHILAFEGTIDTHETLRFTMRLYISQGAVSGEYATSNGDRVRCSLAGEMAADGTMVLHEYKNGISTGNYFDGCLEGSAFSGQYRNALGTTHFDFNAYLQ